jgi:hypothetical protein
MRNQIHAVEGGSRLAEAPALRQKGGLIARVNSCGRRLFLLHHVHILFGSAHLGLGLLLAALL